MIVLDTHIWVWWVNGSPELSASHRRIIEREEDQGLGVSAISVWEVSKLHEKGRIRFLPPLGEWISLALAYPGIQLLPLSPEIAIASTQLPGEFHADPADQIIVATANVLQAPLLTADQKINNYPFVSLAK